MLTCIKDGRVIDPAHSRDRVGDIWMHDARIVDAPAGDRRADQTYDATGKLVMAGAIEIHSHIAGSNVNTARLLLPEIPAPSAAFFFQAEDGIRDKKGDRARGGRGRVL